MTSQVRKKVRPKAFKGFMPNPHKGAATFQRFEGDPLYPNNKWSEEGPTEFPPPKFDGAAPGYLPTTVAYCRWFWNVVEPEEGKVDFTVIEKALATAHERGQTLQVRLMPHGSPTQPQLPQWYIDKYPTRERERNGAKYVAAVYDGAEYLDKWGGLITEFGRRFDGHLDLETVDMAYIGPWGEGDGECSDAGVDRMTKVYCDAHRKTPLLAMITGYKMTAGVRAGAGWRCDSCDDLGLWGDPTAPLEKRWNHLYDCYPRSVLECGAQDAWKTAPVAFEPGMVFATDYEKNFDIDLIIQQDLKYHGSILSMKSTRLPEDWMGKLFSFCNDLGYRYVLRQIEFDAAVRPGGSLPYTCWIENVGVAPIYRRYDLAIRFTQEKNTHLYRSGEDIRKWLPGDVFLQEKIEMPDTFKEGIVSVHAAVVDRETGTPRVKFANFGYQADGWLPLDTIEIRNAGGGDTP